MLTIGFLKDQVDSKWSNEYSHGFLKDQMESKWSNKRLLSVSFCTYPTHPFYPSNPGEMELKKEGMSVKCFS